MSMYQLKLPRLRAKENPLNISHHQMHKLAIKASNVVSEVLRVLGKVSFIELFKTSIQI
jgi:hypothetical protein